MSFRPSPPENLTEGQTLKIHFANQEVLYYFALWLSSMGSQEYWMWMEYRELETAEPITATKFDFWVGGSFLAVNEIATENGRLDEDDAL